MVQLTTIGHLCYRQIGHYSIRFSQTALIHICVITFVNKLRDQEDKLSVGQDTQMTIVSNKILSKRSCTSESATMKVRPIMKISPIFFRKC